MARLRKKPESSIELIPLGFRGLTAIGDETTKAVQRHLKSFLLPDTETADFAGLADAFRKAHWSDQEAAHLFDEYSTAFQEGNRIDVALLTRWVLAHEDDSEAVLDCIRVVPPDEVEIIQILSRAGSQKLVFLAIWRLTLDEVVLKKLIAPDETAEKILARELRSNPLNMVHPNIIETYF